MQNSIFVISIGFLAQIFFSARILVQWILSERAQRVLSPVLFWALSLAGAYLLCIYGWLRNDFAIILGQFISYYIYLWNLQIKGAWQKLPSLIRLLLLATPIAAIIWVGLSVDDLGTRFFHQEDIPLWLLIFGSGGQVLFTLRFVYQWLYSRRQHESQLPAGFWIISLTGATIILIYAILRHDIVLFVGQSFGLVAYSRNLYILKKEHQQNKS